MLIHSLIGDTDELEDNIQVAYLTHATPQDTATLTLNNRLDPWSDVFESEAVHLDTVTATTSSGTELTMLEAQSSTIRRASVPISDIVSDVSRVQTIHATEGYREGISASKSRFIQEGFDEGFALGGEIGQAVGWILGCLEGLMTGSAAPAICTSTSEKTSEEQDWKQDAIQSYQQATHELSLHSIFSKEYISQDGLWNYELRDGMETTEDIATFHEVAWAHPLVTKWNVVLEELSRRADVHLEALRKQSGSIEE